MDNNILTELKIEGYYFKLGDKVKILDNIFEKYPNYEIYKYLGGLIGTIYQIFDNDNIRIRLNDWCKELDDNVVTMQYNEVELINDDIINF